MKTNILQELNIIGMLKSFKRKDKVYDRWWPWRLGIVLKVLKTRLHVKWLSGYNNEADRLWIYDIPHSKFLVRLNARKRN